MGTVVDFKMKTLLRDYSYGGKLAWLPTNLKIKTISSFVMYICTRLTNKIILVWNVYVWNSFVLPFLDLAS